MPQIFDRQILDFLRRKENLGLALEIGDYAAQLQRELLEEFWKQVQDAIDNTRPKGRAADEFVFSQSGVDMKESVLRAIPKSAASQVQHLAFAVGGILPLDTYERYVGLIWKTQLPRADSLYQQAPLRRLKERLIAKEWEDWAPGWVCGRYVQQVASPEGFLCDFADDPAGVLKPLTTAFWEMVRDTEADVAVINKLVASI